MSTRFFSANDLDRLVKLALRTGSAAIYFIPRSHNLDFDTGAFKGLLRDANPAGVILMYPMNKDTWDDRMMAVTPAADDQVFYAVSLL
jgi:hypothetical protein